MKISIFTGETNLCILHGRNVKFYINRSNSKRHISDQILLKFRLSIHEEVLFTNIIKKKNISATGKHFYDMNIQRHR